MEQATGSQRVADQQCLPFGADSRAHDTRQALERHFRQEHAFLGGEVAAENDAGAFVGLVGEKLEASARGEPLAPRWCFQLPQKRVESG